MILVRFRGERRTSFSITTKEAQEWIDMALARWAGRIKGRSVIELIRARGPSDLKWRPDLSVAMPPSEMEKAARGYEPSVLRVIRCRFSFEMAFLPAKRQKVLNEILDGVK